MERSKDWIDSAEGDLQHAQNDMEGGFYNWACFSAQQSAEKAVREQLIQRLKERLDALEEKLPIQLVVLFGSYAKGNYTVASDIDPLIVHKGEERKDAYATVKKIFSIPLLEPHVYSEDQYERLKGNISKMIETGVVLFSRDKH